MILVSDSYSCSGAEQELVDIESGVYMNKIGETVPIRNHLDWEGDECGKADAEWVVAGPDSTGRWFRVSLERFTEAAIQ